ncbi:hypothetical protein [Pseudocolwellia agarivorans]|uniref:hypothetical protein n=1 Tax=Pseudocolwellia agarivorans TaxID=1911682 RepID=UPI0009875581|nr:hypothetical protein [Pseudocolwellia agarivorans]
MVETRERYNPNEVQELDEVIRSSYNDFVRLERRNLLLTSSVTIISAFSGLNPSKGSILGFTFENLTSSAFYLILLALTAYFMAAFLIYSVPNYRDAKEARKAIVAGSHTLEYSRPWYSIVPPNIGTDSRYYCWVFIHFILPVLAGLASCIVGVLNVT